MKIILTFENFINESYLESGRQPLYHITGELKKILKSDMLKTNIPAIQFDNYPEESISLSRNVNYGHSGFIERLVLDADKLKHNYKIVPVDEVGLAYNQAYNQDDKKQNKVFIHKKFSGSPDRWTKNNIYKYSEDEGMELEFEERIFKNIKNLGKYLIAIQFTTIEEIERRKEMLEEYLTKYPHIKIQLVNIDDLNEKPVDINIYELVK